MADSDTIYFKRDVKIDVLRRADDINPKASDLNKWMSEQKLIRSRSVLRITKTNILGSRTKRLICL